MLRVHGGYSPTGSCVQLLIVLVRRTSLEKEVLEVCIGERLLRAFRYYLLVNKLIN